MRRPGLRSRLAAAFVLVALSGIVLMAVLAILAIPGRVSQLVIDQEDQAAQDVARALGEAYRKAGGWQGADLGPARDVAGAAGGQITALGGSGADHQQGSGGPTQAPSAGTGGAGQGSPQGGAGAGAEGSGGPSQTPAPGAGAGSSSGPGEAPGSPSGTRGTASPKAAGSPQGSVAGRADDDRGTGASDGALGVVALAAQAPLERAADEDARTVTVPVLVDGERVGTVTLRFPEGLGVAERNFESRLRWMVVIAAALATVLAVAVALFVARRVGGPVDRLIGAVRRIETGDLSARAESARAPGELGELASSFDRMAAALAREDELRRVLVADVAHEIRTPVTILQASLEQMVDGTVEAEPQTLSSLHDEVLRLGRVVADLESLAQAQAARLEMRVHPVDLAQVTGEALGRLEASFGDADLQADRELAPVAVMGDPARLGQVVTNLLTNALKFTPAGGRVLVTVDRWDGLARLQVEDTGPGIPAEELDHVFDRFWRGSAGRSAGGSGVGLAVVAELVRAHGGRVDVASAPGRGARFTVLIPQA